MRAAGDGGHSSLFRRSASQRPTTVVIEEVSFVVIREVEEEETPQDMRRCPAPIEGDIKELRGPREEIPSELEPVNACELLTMLGFTRPKA